MGKLMLFLCLFCTKAFGQFVGYNDPNAVFGGQNQNIRPFANTNQPAIDQLPLGNRIVCINRVSGGQTPAGGSFWYSVDIPTSGTTAANGYVAAGLPYIVPLCNVSYAIINNPNINYINIRTSADESAPLVTIEGLSARVINNQKFALVSTSYTQNGNYRWYQIYLTGDCSQTTGWIAGYSIPSGNNWITVSSSSVNELTTPSILSVSGITNNSAILSITNSINYYYRTYSVYLNGVYQKDYSAIGTTSIAQITVNELAPGTSYNISVIEKNNAGCVSPQSSNYSFATTGTTGCAFNISPTSSTISSSGGTGFINVSANSGCNWTASATGYSWITISNGSSGSGSGTCSYSIASNSNSSSRTGYITIAGQSFSITQSGTTTECSDPSIVSQPSNVSAPAGTSTGFGVSVTGGTSPYSYQWQLSTNGGSTWANITNAGSSPTYSNWNSASLVISNLVIGNNGYRYRCVVSSGSPCTSNSTTSNSAILTVTSVSSGTISVNYSNTIIPPWQRENDNYDGYVSVTRSNSSAAWHLEIDVLSSAGAYERAIIYPSTTASTQPFNTATNTTANNQLKQYSIEGKIIRYYVVLENTSPLLAERVEGNVNVNDGKTIIIERKWEMKNYVYYNDSSDLDMLRLPILWSKDNPQRVRFSRVGLTSTDLDLKKPVTLLDLKNQFQIVGGSGYLEIKSSTSNIADVNLLPGDFKYEVIGSSGNVLEFGYFDLTKIGRINGKKSNRLLVMVGGILNFMEISAKNLRDDKSSSEISSDKTYSFLENCGKYCTSDFSTWYIAQGNANYIKRNGYDIGIALEKIRKYNDVNAIEIDLLCHSKGGVDVRSMLTGKNISYDGKTSYQLTDSSMYGLIKKVVFIASPHRGARIADWLSLISNPAQIPAAIDLMRIPINNSIDELNKTQHPELIKYLNITGYVGINFAWDGVVKVPESSNPSLGIVDLKQLYQDDSRFLTGNNPLEAFHMEIHKNKFLSYIGGLPTREINCTQQNSNLTKIRMFLDNPSQVATCSDLFFGTYSGFIIGSVNPGVTLNFKSKTNSNKLFLGRTDENGILNFDLAKVPDTDDSIEYISNGYEPLVVPAKNLSFPGVKLVLFKSNTGTSHLKYPSISFVDNVFITQKPSINLKIACENLKELYIRKANSSNNFIPLGISNNISNVLLDTGYNQLQIKFIGNDTLILTKDVYYYPDTLYNLVTNPITIKTNSTAIGAKLFLNNQYYSDVKSDNTEIRLLKGFNELKFIKFGFRDTTIRSDSKTDITIHMTPQNYSSTVDSGQFDFTSKVNPQYWKSVSLMSSNLSANAKFSIKQFDVHPNYLGISPISRMFLFTKAITNSNSLFKLRIILDQIKAPESDSVFFLFKKGSWYRKMNGNELGLTEYDFQTQKVGFDSLTFSANENSAEFLILKKQKAQFKPLTLTLKSGEQRKLPASDFVTDPDSLKNDITLKSVFVSNPNVSIQIMNNEIIIHAKRGYTGFVLFTLSSTHDFLVSTKSYFINILPPDIPVNTPRIYPNPTAGLIKVEYILENKKDCSIRVYNQLGQLVQEFERSYQNPGYYTETFDVSHLPSGTYIVKLNVGKTAAQFVKQ